MIPSPSPSVKIQIIGRKVCLRYKGKKLLDVFNKILKITSSKPSRQKFEFSSKVKVMESNPGYLDRCSTMILHISELSFESSYKYKFHNWKLLYLQKTFRKSVICRTLHIFFWSHCDSSSLRFSLQHHDILNTSSARLQYGLWPFFLSSGKW